MRQPNPCYNITFVKIAKDWFMSKTRNTTQKLNAT
jgi:hypothetical protein